MNFNVISNLEIKILNIINLDIIFKNVESLEINFLDHFKKQDGEKFS